MTTEKKQPLVPEVLPTEANSASWRKLKAFSENKKGSTQPKIIDFDQFEALAQRMVPLRDIAPSLGVHRDTLNKHCKKHFEMTSKEVWNFYAASGRKRLLIELYEDAKNGCKTSRLLLLRKYAGIASPDEEQVEDEQVTEINYKPSIKGYEGNPEDIKNIMLEFLDLPDDHPAKNHSREGKDDKAKKEAEE
jgi:hypothetical protein